MSSLTDEQRKRIEENRARALAKLDKKKSAATYQSKNNAGGNIRTGVKHSTSNNTKLLTFNDRQTEQRVVTAGQDLSRFENRYGKNSASPYEASNKGLVCTSVKSQSTFGDQGRYGTKSVNDALMKAKVVQGSCVLMSKTRFKVVVGYHGKLIGILKSLPSKCYGR